MGILTHILSNIMKHSIFLFVVLATLSLPTIFVEAQTYPRSNFAGGVVGGVCTPADTCDQDLPCVTGNDRMSSVANQRFYAVCQYTFNPPASTTTTAGVEGGPCRTTEPACDFDINDKIGCDWHDMTCKPVGTACGTLPFGTAGCPCASDNSCTGSGVCVDGLCISCTPGDLNCVCLPGDGANAPSCNNGAVCFDDRVCVEPARVETPCTAETNATCATTCDKQPVEVCTCYEPKKTGDPWPPTIACVPTEPEEEAPVGIIVASIGGGLLLISLIVVAVYLLKKRSDGDSTRMNPF